MKIAIILGSVRQNRKSNFVADHLTVQLNNSEGIEAKLLDLRNYSFPIMAERFRFLKNPPEGMAEFSETITDADGIIIVSPEYNGSYSGVLKNTLDYFKGEYYKKPMGVVTVSSGSWGGINASHHIQSWVLSVKAFPSPFKLMVQNVNSIFNDDGEMVDKDFIRISQKFIEEFLWLTRAISSNV